MQPLTSQPVVLNVSFLSCRFGRRAVYLTSTAMFLATSLVCVFAPNIGVLVAFRALQGAAGMLDAILTILLFSPRPPLLR